MLFSSHLQRKSVEEYHCHKNSHKMIYTWNSDIFKRKEDRVNIRAEMPSLYLLWISHQVPCWLKKRTIGVSNQGRLEASITMVGTRGQVEGFSSWSESSRGWKKRLLDGGSDGHPLWPSPPRWGNSSPKSNESSDYSCQDNRRIYKGNKRHEFHKSALFSTKMGKPKLREDTSEDYYTCGQPETSYQFDNSSLTSSKPHLICVLTDSQSRPNWSLNKMQESLRHQSPFHCGNSDPDSWLWLGILPSMVLCLRLFALLQRVHRRWILKLPEPGACDPGRESSRASLWEAALSYRQRD